MASPASDSLSPGRRSLAGDEVRLPDPCWNQRGIYGDSSCDELARLVHCHNCQVYSAAGAQLLNRPLPADYRREWTEHFSRQKQSGQADSASALIFRVENEWLALPTLALGEITERRTIHSLPHRCGGSVLGLANVRGELLICISLARLVGLQPTSPELPPARGGGRLLVANWGGQRFGFPVDAIFGTQRFDRQDLKSPPGVGGTSQSVIEGVFCCQEQAVGLLNPDLLFTRITRNLT